MKETGYELWINYANDEMWAASTAFENGRYSQCTARSHDAAEKILKAVMIKNRIDLERIHLINRLAMELRDVMPVLEQMCDDILDLDYTFMPARYPSAVIMIGQ